MQKVYEINLSPEGIAELQKILSTLGTIITDSKFLEYIGNKCKLELEKICTQKLSTITKENIDKSNYMNSNHLKIEGDTIYLYNNSKIDISSKNMKETTKAKYPAQLSLAKIVEYGIGYTGSINTDKSEVENWEYDVNNHGYRGWYYIDDNGQTVWTNGFDGRLIFYNLKLAIEKNVKKWVKEYIEMKL